MHKSIKNLKTFGNDYFKDSFFKPKPMADIKYNKNYLQIGRTLDGKTYALDLTEAVRIVMLGATRSGKTWNIRQLADRLIKTDRAVVFLPDIKNEFISSRQPVQEKFRHLLLPGETPQAMNVVTLRPTFFKTINPDLPKNNYWYSVNMKKLSRADFMTLMNVDELTQPQKVVLEIIYQKLQEKYNANPTLNFSVQLIDEIIDEITEINASQKTSIKFKFKPLEHAHFHESQHENSIVSIMEKGGVPAFNFENFENFGRGSFLFPEVVLSIAMREIIMARRAGKIKPLWIFMDECLRFLGENKNSSYKMQVLECLEENTEIITNNGIKKIRDIDDKNDKVLSYNFQYKYEYKNCKLFGEKEKEIFEIELEGGKKVKASAEHRFFVLEKDSSFKSEKKGWKKIIKEKMLKDIKEGDEIIFGKFNKCKCCGIIIKKSTKICHSCQNRGKNNPIYGRKNPHTDEVKKRIKTTLEKNYNSEIGIEIKKKISKSSSRPYSERIKNKDTLKKLIELRRKDFKYRRNNDKIFLDTVKNGTNKGRKLNQEWRENIGKASKKFYNDLTNKEKISFMKKTLWKNKGYKTNLEIFSEEVFKESNIDLIFNGRGKRSINGFAPDFINIKKKIAVEVYSDYYKVITFGSVDNYKKKRIEELTGWKVFFFNHEFVYNKTEKMIQVLKNEGL